MNYRDKIDTESCYFCARVTGIDAHHIVPQRFNGSDRRENLVGICERCHTKIENLYDKRFYEKLGVEDESGERKNHFECDFNCSKRAKAKVAKDGKRPFWLCLGCATSHYDNGSNSILYEDTSGRMDQRVAWLDAIEENPYEVAGL